MISWGAEYGGEKWPSGPGRETLANARTTVRRPGLYRFLGSGILSLPRGTEINDHARTRMPKAASSYPDRITPRQAEYLGLIEPGEIVTAQELANRANSLYRTRTGRKTWPRPVPTFTATYQLKALQRAKKVKRMAGGGHGVPVEYRRIS